MGLALDAVDVFKKLEEIQEAREREAPVHVDDAEVPECRVVILDEPLHDLHRVDARAVLGALAVSRPAVGDVLLVRVEKDEQQEGGAERVDEEHEDRVGHHRERVLVEARLLVQHLLAAVRRHAALRADFWARADWFRAPFAVNRLFLRVAREYNALDFALDTVVRAHDREDGAIALVEVVARERAADDVRNGRKEHEDHVEGERDGDSA
mmetsp:Transcript_5570/g.12765  ORF Transcript_5570/g.12765 Transcript_5570/m.12765 type:complete len:210 (+) Transcript_5570:781-1410(+)